MATMTSEEMGSPGSASGLAQDAPTIIRIPLRAILDIVLAELGIPEAEYRREICDDNKICVTVLFDASTVEGAPAHMSISGTYSTDDEVAEDTAALKAIEYLETAANVVIRDYSYDKLKRLEEETERLMEQLEEANYCISKLVRGWLLAVRCVCSFSHSLKLLLGNVSWMRL
ncbi:uncharacterized protein LOC119278247 [Triticum dicoccoides]|uniref:Uncharacterized protein n=1 Tax=Triticum turgidum subsp. durum TaxID=4567 RepID=A0A9R1S893_TRITD|nr:uncharacterized protein LOC119278247 [Triticum dicoccoides]VAH83946.1 unnamed protein product [Triticum turgidum subsp. durum]